MLQRTLLVVATVSLIFVVPQSAHANPECPDGSPFVGCIGNFDPAPPGGGGGGRPITFLSIPFASK